MTDTARLYVKNWQKFQHYKHRNPPWIRLYRALLDDYDFQGLPLASRALAFQFWLLASESDDGSIPAASNVLAFRMHCASTEVDAAVSDLIRLGFLSHASNTLADCMQHARPETETETEAEQVDGSKGARSVLNEEKYKKNTECEAEKDAQAHTDTPGQTKSVQQGKTDLQAGADLDAEVSATRLDAILGRVAKARQLDKRRKAETG